MSQGTRVVTLRLGTEREAAVLAALASRNARTADRPWTVSDWIRAAVDDKLKHLARGSKPRNRRLPNADGPGGAEAVNLATTAQSCGMTPADLAAHLDRQDAFLAELLEGGGES